MLRKVTVLAAAFAALASGVLPASAATTSHHPRVHHFGVGGVNGISAWGSYQKTGKTVRVTLCVRDNSPAVGEALFNALAIARDGRSNTTFGVTVYTLHRTDCSTTYTSDTGALIVIAAAASANGQNAQFSQPKVIYGNLLVGESGAVGILLPQSRNMLRH
jgi:hypothetical protein